MKLAKVATIGFFAGLCWVSSQAFPPAPHHTLFGVVRDELGNPIALEDASVVLETTSGTKLTTKVIPELEPGANYRIHVPMDAGLTADAYRPTALRPTVPFKMYVRIGQVNYLPIEMRGNFGAIGEPSKRTRVDLTLGEDADGDGLPDAWERAILAIMGGDRGLGDVNGGDDFDGDGLSNLSEYLSGTYAFDPEDGYNLKIAGSNGAKHVLEFLAIRGRSYQVQGSADFKTWTRIQFRVPEIVDSDAASSYYAEDTRNLRIEAAAQNGETFRFYKLLIQ